MKEGRKEGLNVVFISFDQRMDSNSESSRW